MPDRLFPNREKYVYNCTHAARHWITSASGERALAISCGPIIFLGYARQLGADPTLSLTWHCREPLDVRGVTFGQLTAQVVSAYHKWIDSCERSKATGGFAVTCEPLPLRFSVFHLEVLRREGY